MRIELLRGETKVMLTPVFRLMAPGRREDLHHLMIVCVVAISSLYLASANGV